MPKLREYVCPCGRSFEYIHMSPEDLARCECGREMTSDDERLGGVLFHVIVPMHRTSLKNKAGYVHTHGDRPAEKSSVAVPRGKESP
jgi:hypothetical protein